MHTTSTRLPPTCRTIHPLGIDPITIPPAKNIASVPISVSRMSLASSHRPITATDSPYAIPSTTVIP
jgi:hypothetical protein